MISIILAIPETDTLDTLSQEQRNLINSLKSQWVSPMPGTRSHNGKYIVDAILADDFNNDVLPPSWEVFYLGTQDGNAVVSLNSAFIDYIADINIMDNKGNVVDRVRPSKIKIPHRWGGWPERI